MSNTETDTSKEAVERYNVKPWDSYSADIVRDTNGPMVSYEDYAAQAAHIEQLEAELAMARNDALIEAADVDFRTLWLSNYERMKKAGESKEMAGRWFPELCRAEILALITQEPKP